MADAGLSKVPVCTAFTPASMFYRGSLLQASTPVHEQVRRTNKMARHHGAKRAAGTSAQLLPTLCHSCTHMAAAAAAGPLALQALIWQLQKAVCKNIICGGFRAAVCPFTSRQMLKAARLQGCVITYKRWQASCSPWVSKEAGSKAAVNESR